MNRKSIVAGLLCVATIAAAEKIPDLESGFQNPPRIARPGVWWHWINGNVTKKGVDFDLEAMKEAGLAGATIFHIGDPDEAEVKKLLGVKETHGTHGTGIPAGPVRHGDEKWFELMDHAATKALELGLELGMHNSPGFCGASGPWITPENAQRGLVWSETAVKGPAPIEIDLSKAFKSTMRSQSLINDDSYRDVAVVAFPKSAFETARPDEARLEKALFPFALFDQCPKLTRRIPREAVVDISDKMDATGRLRWDVPDGEWIVQRFGHAPTGEINHPAPRGGFGLSSDHYSRAATLHHWEKGVQPLLDRLGDKVGRSFNYLLIDSIEGSDANWTPTMPEEFARRRGYSITLFLPVLAGVAVDSIDLSNRFLADFRATRSDLWEDNFIGTLRDKCHENHMTLRGEVYGTKNFRSLGYGAALDAPMTEFWCGTSSGGHGMGGPRTKAAASAAHIHGKRLVPAEAFTSEGEFWKHTPWILKGTGDAVFCGGVNKLMFHDWPHQPWAGEQLPGMTMGRHGTVFGGTLTWWPQARAWIDYLARCQWMLQEGRHVADIAVLHDVETESFPQPDGLSFDQNGYRSDQLDRTSLLKMIVESGELALPTGPRYRLLYLPPPEPRKPELKRAKGQKKNWKADAELVAKLHQLVQDGVVILGDRPLYIPRLAATKEEKAKTRDLLDQLWPETVGDKSETKLGKGMVLRGYRPDEALRKLGVKPDLHISDFGWIHRCSDTVDWYFIANLGTKNRSSAANFRVTGKRPEFWNPETGEITYPAAWNDNGETTEIPLTIGPLQSRFVVFRDSAKGLDPLREITPISVRARLDRDGKVTLLAEKSGAVSFKTASGQTGQIQVDVPGPLPVKGPWNVTFQKNRGGPDTPVVFNELGDWTKSEDPRVKYFSGHADYNTEFELPAGFLAPDRRVVLDLGEMNDLAEITVNNQNLGVSWMKPHQIDITDALQPGKNQMTIRVVNTWVNRAIGDEFFPDDRSWSPEPVFQRRTKHNSWPITDWPDWLLENKPRPSERHTFFPWKYWTKDDPLLPSGLLGPVELRTTVAKTIIDN